MKYWLKSKTIWLGALATALPAIEANFHLLKSVLSEDAYNVSLMFMSVVGALVIYFRTITTQPVARKKAVEKSVQ
jgi:hypothetical protein